MKLQLVFVLVLELHRTVPAVVMVPGFRTFAACDSTGQQIGRDNPIVRGWHCSIQEIGK